MEKSKEVKKPVVKAKIELLDESKEYVFVSNGKSKHMPKDAEYSVSGVMANLFISKGYGLTK